VSDSGAGSLLTLPPASPEKHIAAQELDEIAGFQKSKGQKSCHKSK
jgi:hypothetical protein